MNLDNPDTLSAFLAAQEWAAQRQQMMAASRIYPDAALPSYEEAATLKRQQIKRKTSKPRTQPRTAPPMQLPRTEENTTRPSTKNSASSNVSSIDMDHLPSYEAALRVMMRNEPDFSLPNMVPQDQDSDSSHERSE